MNRWPEAIGLAITAHALILLLPFQLQGSLGPDAGSGTEQLVEITLIESVPPRVPQAVPQDPRSDTLRSGRETPTVRVQATDRPRVDTPALTRPDPHTSQPEPEPEPPDGPAETHRFVRADPDVPVVEAPDSAIISDRNLVAAQTTRREIATPRIGPPNDGDPSATDVAGASATPDTLSMPRVQLSDEPVPLLKNRQDPSRPGARSGGEPLRSRAEAPEAPQVGAPGGQDVQQVASRGAEAITAKGAREPGEAGDDAPTREGLAFASDGSFPAPSTGGADPADPLPEGPDLPSRSDQEVRPLLSPGILDWIKPAQSADGGQPRTEVGEADTPAPRAGEGTEGEGQTRVGEATGIADATPGERERQLGSRAAAGGTGSALMDSATVLPEDIPLDVEALVSAVETPLGRYAASIDQLLREAWAPPLEAQVMSGYGVTTIQFRVDNRGRVTDKELTRLSGVPGLDIAALGAVPQRVPRPDRDLMTEQDHLTVTYTFRHSSPIVSRSAHH